MIIGILVYWVELDYLWCWIVVIFSAGFSVVLGIFLLLSVNILLSAICSEYYGTEKAIEE